jgi:hypothetical protein
MVLKAFQALQRTIDDPDKVDELIEGIYSGRLAGNIRRVPRKETKTTCGPITKPISII